MSIPLLILELRPKVNGDDKDCCDWSRIFRPQIEQAQNDEHGGSESSSALDLHEVEKKGLLLQHCYGSSELTHEKCSRQPWFASLLHEER